MVRRMTLAATPSTPKPTLLPLPTQPNGVPWPTRTWPHAELDPRVDREQLARLLDHAFGDSEPEDLEQPIAGPTRREEVPSVEEVGPVATGEAEPDRPVVLADPALLHQEAEPVDAKTEAHLANVPDGRRRAEGGAGGKVFGTGVRCAAPAFHGCNRHDRTGVE